MGDIQSITVSIDGHVYPLKVRNSEQEEKIRAAVKLINEKMVLYKQNFNAQESKPYDFLAMVAIDLVTQYISNKNKSDDSEFMTELRLLSGEVNEYIQKSQAL